MATRKKNTTTRSGKTTAKPRANDAINVKAHRLRYEIKMIGLLAFTIFSIVSLYTSAVGAIGTFISDIVFGLFGYIGYIIPFIVFSYVFVWINPNLYPAKKRFLIGLSSVTLSLMVLSALISHGIHGAPVHSAGSSLLWQEVYQDSLQLKSGGLAPEWILFWLNKYFGHLGAYIFSFAMLVMGFIVLTRISIQELWEKKRLALEESKQAKALLRQEHIDKMQQSAMIKEKKVKPDSGTTSYVNQEEDFLTTIERRRKAKDKKDIKAFDYDTYEKSEPIKTEPAKSEPAKAEVKDPFIEDKPKETKAQPIQPDITYESHEMPQAVEKPIKKLKATDIDEATKNVVTQEIEKGAHQTVENYQLPPIDLLTQPKVLQRSEDKHEYLEMAQLLEDTLNNFGVDAKVMSVKKGPSITMFEIQPSPGVKVSKIVGLSDDIALNLATSHVRIAPIPGKAAIGIEVPNKSTSMVTFREVITSEDFKKNDSKLTIGLGKDISGNPIIGDLSSMPHLLIAGATGSGKSVCVNTIVASILYNATPEEVKFLMIDPKVVELSNYNGIPHLILPVVTDPKKASIALNWAVNEMTRRYKLFAEFSVRDMKGYNKKAELGQHEKLSQIVVIIDELADLMMVAPNQVEDAICRLAQMARAAGIHLIVATQRPSVDVITGLIKANIPSRIAFSVSSSIDSRTIIDMGGAEKLLGKGDMLYYPVGASKPKRAQGAFMSDEEVEVVVSYIKNQALEVHYNEEILDDIQSSTQAFDEDVDEHLEDAIAFVVETGQASASLLQRRFRVGYNRAARLVESMEERGIVGPSRGSKPREVLLSSSELRQLDDLEDEDASFEELSIDKENDEE